MQQRVSIETISIGAFSVGDYTDNLGENRALTKKGDIPFDSQFPADRGSDLERTPSMVPWLSNAQSNASTDHYLAMLARAAERSTTPMVRIQPLTTMRRDSRTESLASQTLSPFEHSGPTRDGAFSWSAGLQPVTEKATQDEDQEQSGVL